MAAMPTRSDSVSSNGSQSQISSDHIQIFVNTSAGKSIKLNVLPTHSIANVLEFLSASTSFPSGSKLVFAGKQLEPSSTVADLKLSAQATLNLLIPTRGSQEPESADMTATGSLPQSQVSTTTSSTATSRTSTPKSGTRKPKKPRCAKDGCSTAAQPIVGDCGFCQLKFCGKHRMLESHNCSGLDAARQADKDRNAAKLEGERTIMLRGL